MAMRRRAATPKDKAAFICRNCASEPNYLIDDLCPACYHYFKEHKKHRPKYKRSDLDNISEWLQFIANDAKGLRKQFKGDNELIRLVESVEFSMGQLQKALNERRKEGNK